MVQLHKKEEMRFSGLGSAADRINSIFYAFGSIVGSEGFARKSRYTYTIICSPVQRRHKAPNAIEEICDPEVEGV